MPNTLSLNRQSSRRMSIAVVGTGISGMSAAWLLSRNHDVTVFEKDDRIGGHSNTVNVQTESGPIPVDTGFIVLNDWNYPNLMALLKYIDVPTVPTEMSFAASLDQGKFEYSGSSLAGLLAQPLNALRPRMWSMVRDTLRFFREAPIALQDRHVADMTLGDYLKLKGYRKAFINDYLLPMGAAIWSCSTRDMLDYPLEAFVRFSENHGLLSLNDRPQWHTVVGGSQQYVRKLTESFEDKIRLNTGVRAIRRSSNNVAIEDRHGNTETFDHVVIAAHADQALSMLSDADPAERRLLGDFKYERNVAMLHTDQRLMPRSKRAWSSWNFLSQGRGDEQKVSVTYWMNHLQHLPKSSPLFVSLNPVEQPAEGSVIRSFLYEHPLFDTAAIRAQRLLWNIQGMRRTWYCGAYMGHGFHEDGLQAGLAVAEQLGGGKRPWHLDEPNSRIHCHSNAAKERAA